MRTVSAPLLPLMETEITEHPHLLTAYRVDFDKCDREVLSVAQPGEEYVWLIREMGTQLLQLHQGADPTHILYYIHPVRCGSALPRAYRLSITAQTSAGPIGILQHITHTKAIALAQLPAPDRKTPNDRIRAVCKHLDRLSSQGGDGCPAHPNSCSYNIMWGLCKTAATCNQGRLQTIGGSVAL